VLKRDKRAIFSAAAHAHRAVEFLHGLQAVRNRGRLMGGPFPSGSNGPGVCSSELRYTSAAAGPNLTGSVLSVARALDRRPVCSVSPAVPAIPPGGADS
jgi:hypothetical protein